MKLPMYTGATGFTDRAQAIAALNADGNEDRQLMIGVLASEKTLRGEQLTQSRLVNRYPPIDSIASIFIDHPAVLNLVHYNTRNSDGLCEQLYELTKKSGPHCHGFQLNMAWPDPKQLLRFHLHTSWEKRIVLQIGAGAMKVLDDNPKRIADKVGEYLGAHPVIRDVLIDASGGLGKDFALEDTRKLVREICSRHYEVNLGVAGGLHAGNIYRLVPLLEEANRFGQSLNFDAEGKLRRTPEDPLDVRLTASYLVAVEALLLKH